MNKVRVLLADDHAVVRAGIRNAVEEIPGVEIVGEVGDGPALLAALERLRPGCLLIDVSMPDFDPLAATSRIRAQYPALKILVVSAYDDDLYVQGLLRAGVDGYHLKDQPLSDLRLALQRVLEGEKWITGRLVDKLLRYSDAHSPAPLLTARQREILSLLQQGLDNQHIAQQLGLSVKTIENHLTRLYRQLDVQSRLEAVNYVRQNPQVLALSGKQAVADPAAAASAAQKPVTILLVDDNPRYRRQLRRVIGRVSPQATIYEAGDIQEALHLTQRVLPRLALVDVVLSDTEDGIRCTRRIKALSPASRVILISAYPDREFHRRGLEAGAVAFLDKKNLDKATLQQIINDVLA